MQTQQPGDESEIPVLSSVQNKPAHFPPDVTQGAIAKAGSFRGPALIVPAGVAAGLIAVSLRGGGIFVEGPITVPAAAALEAEAPAPEPA